MFAITCPFRRPATWAQARRDTPELFWRAVELERLLNQRRDELGRDHVYLTRFGKPLDEAIPEAPSHRAEAEVDGPGSCDEGLLLDMTRHHDPRAAEAIIGSTSRQQLGCRWPEAAVTVGERG